MNAPEFSIVICVGCKDVFVVKKVIRQIRRGFIIGGDTIYLLTNSRFFCFYSEQYCDENNVVLLDESKLLPNLNIKIVRDLVNRHFTEPMRAGWYFQQFLKMGFALTEYAKDYYLIWDADTFPTTPLQFFDDHGSMLLTQKEEYHRPYFETMKRLIGLGKTVDFSFIAEHMLVKTNYMRELIHTIEKNEIKGEYWFEKVINAIEPSSILGFSEFETYGTWVNCNHRDSISYRRLRTMRDAGCLYGRAIKEKELKKYDGITDTISVEARDFPPFPRNIYQYAQFAFLYMLKP